MIWKPTFFTALLKGGKYRIEVWQGYDGEWRASVHFRHNLTGIEGKKTQKSLEAAKAYGLKLFRIYRKNTLRKRAS